MRLYSHMSEEQSPPGNRTSCARGGSIGFLSKINAEIRIQLETTIHYLSLYQRPLEATCYLSREEKRKREKCYSQSSPHLLIWRGNQAAVLEWWPLNEWLMRKQKLLEWQGIFKKIQKYSRSWQQESHQRFNQLAQTLYISLPLLHYFGINRLL